MENQIVDCPECQTKNPSDSVFCNKCGTQFGFEKQESVSFTKTMIAPGQTLTKGGTLAERYQILEELGQGGMGFVYKVTDTKIHEDVALKVLRPEVAANRETITRFGNELKYARKITHKNVCRMHDINEAAGIHFITMEYVEGENLKSVIKRMGKLKLGNMLSFALQITDGLAEAHSLGIVHRDLKPQNIMIDTDGNAKIMDFGIARSDESKGLTAEGVVIGTPEYMSPEQVEGKKVDQRSDIYALGVIFYEMVTGKIPFSGESAFSVALKHKSEKPQDPRNLNSQLPEGMARAILRCMEKDSNKRYQNVEELQAVLMAIEEMLPEKERVVQKIMPRVTVGKTGKSRLKKMLVPALVSSAIVLAGVVAWLIMSPSSPNIPPAPDRSVVAIIPFKNDSGDGQLDKYRTILASMLTHDLMQSKFISVADEIQVFGALTRLNLSEFESLSEKNLHDLAEEVVVTHILKGVFIKLGETFRVMVTLLDARTLEPLAAANEDGVGEDALFSIVDNLTIKIKPHFNLTQEQINDDLDEKIEEVTTPNPRAFQYYLEGKMAFNNLEFDRSIEALKNAVLLDPDFSMAFRRLSGVYNILRERTGNQEYNEKSNEYAKQAYEAIKRRSPSKREQLFIESGFSNNPFSIWEEILKLYPDDFWANNSLGTLYCRDFAEYGRAQELLEVLVRANSAEIPTYSWLGRAYEAQGLYDKAQEIYAHGHKRYPDSPVFYNFIARAYVKDREFGSALAWCEKGYELNPGELLKFGIKGHTFLFMENFELAEKEYLRQLQNSDLTSERRTAYLNLMRLYRTQGRFDGVISLAERANQVGIESDKFELDTICVNLVRSYLAKRLYQDGLGVCEKIIDTRKRIKLEGELYAKMHLWQKAEDVGSVAENGREIKWPPELRIYLDEHNLVPLGTRDMRRIYQGLKGQMAFELGDFDSAVEHFEQAKQMCASLHHEDLSYYSDSLAITYFEKGDLEKAKQEYELLGTMTYGRKDHGEIYAKSYYMLGKIYEQLGKKRDARKNYERFLSIWKNADPGLPEVDDARTRLAGLRR